MSAFEPRHPAKPDSPQHLVGVSRLAAFLVRCAVASRLEQRVRTPIQHHCRGCHGDDGYSVTHASLQTVVPLVVGNGDQTWDERSTFERKMRFVFSHLHATICFCHTCWKDSGYVISVPGHQRGYDPGVTVTREAHGMCHLENGGGFFFSAEQEDDGTLKLLHLVLDLRVAVVDWHVQQQHLLQLPADKTVLDGAPDLRGDKTKRKAIKLLVLKRTSCCLQPCSLLLSSFQKKRASWKKERAT